METHHEAFSVVEDLTHQLDLCKRDLDKAEKERATAMASTIEVEALKKQLSDKEKEVFDLYSELSWLKQELQRKVKAEEILLSRQSTYMVRPYHLLLLPVLNDQDHQNRMHGIRQKKSIDQNWQIFISRSDHYRKRSTIQIAFVCNLRMHFSRR